MNVDFELYKVFYYVGKHLSFSEASSQLHISQSAVSQTIRQLEEKMECRLFHRSTKQVQFTHEGQLLFRHIEQAFHYIKAGERSIAEIHSLNQGEIRIGASDTICRYYLLPFLKQFAQRYPNIKMIITNRSSAVCLDMVSKGIIDVGVVNLRNEKTIKNITARRLKTLQDIFVAGSAFQSLKKTKLHLADLRQFPLLLLEKNTVTRDFFDKLAETYHVTLAPEIELNSIDFLIDLTKIGLGISFVAKEYVDADLVSGALFALVLHEPIPSRHLGIVTNDSVPMSVATQRFIEILQNE